MAPNFDDVLTLKMMDIVEIDLPVSLNESVDFNKIIDGMASGNPSI
jgi:hypothetical protein